MINYPTITSTSGYDLLEQMEFFRLVVQRKLDAEKKVRLGQFFTPSPVAHMMAAMLTGYEPYLHILDAGAGIGTLFAAYIDEICRREIKPRHISITACEIDGELVPYIEETLRLCQRCCESAGITFSSEIILQDFIEYGTEMLRTTLFSSKHKPPFNYAVLNPPYHKLQSTSVTRKLLSSIGIETSNVYASFLAIVARLLEPQGEMVAITPRSFCNGPYFTSFRKDFLHMMAPQHIHVFETRTQAFHDDDVLQENIIVYAKKTARRPTTVTLTSSTQVDDDFVASRQVPYEQIVHPDDAEAFIHLVPDELGQQVTEQMQHFHTTLEDLGFNVSTGRVVDFRAREHLRAQYQVGTAPLLFPMHTHYGFVSWPRGDTKKPEAIAINEQTATLLVPNEYYVLVKRFSAKEEKRRIVAAIYDSTDIPGACVGFENHLNYFHCQGRGISPTLARGLAAYLNSMLVDSYFRQFSGHTQVNAMDLRKIRYPTASQLEALGARIGAKFPSQQEVDQLVNEVLLDMPAEQDSMAVRQRIDEALSILKLLGLPRSQQNERSALTLLALLNLTPTMLWSEADAPLCGITPMMEFFNQHYGKNYAPNTRETVRRQTVHQFLDAGLVVANPDEPERPVTSPKAVYQIEKSALELFRSFGTSVWEKNLRTYLASVETLKQRYAREREMLRIPLQLAPDKIITLSPGGQNILIKHIVEDFAPHYTPGAQWVYIGDTANKSAYFDEALVTSLDVKLDMHGKIPDVIIYHQEKNWLVLVEAVTSHGPIDALRKGHLERLFQGCKAHLVFVTAFLERKEMIERLDEIAWETDVWLAETPTHMVHFNGEKFLGPHQ